MSINKLQLKRSAVVGKIPTTASLDLGELAINTIDGKIYFKQQDTGSTQRILELTTTSGSMLSASYAQTASYSDQFRVAGTLTAQTLIVQTISSSIIYSSGSNTFGNSLANNQIFTGSVSVTGSLTVNGRNYLTDSSSFSTRTLNLEQTSASVLLATASLYTATASLYAATSSIYLTTASLYNFSASINSYTSSNNATVLDIQRATASLYNASASLYAASASINSFSASILNFTSSQLVLNGKYATTASNQFNGNQTITGSLIQGLEGNIATGEYSHAEGSITKAIGNYSHAEGDYTQAKGDYSHAEGQETIASGSYSHAEGYQTIALANHQHVQGQFNAISSVPAAFIVGNGTDDSNRSNLIHAAGNEVGITGSLKVIGSAFITGSVNVYGGGFNVDGVNVLDTALAYAIALG
jgi:hypothetical protein